MRKIFYILIIISITAPVFSQMFNAEELEIIELQDMRTLGDNNRLLDFLKSPNHNTVIRALWALANISDTNTAVHVGEILLNSDNEEIRSEAAYSLGQIPCAVSVSMLLKALGSETSPVVTASVIDALGFTGNENELKIISGYYSDDDAVNSALGLAVGRLARRNIKTSGGTLLLKRLTKTNKDSTVQKFVSYGFYNIRNGELLLPARDEILSLTRSSSTDARMWAYSSLGYIGNPEDLNYGLNNYENLEPWYVCVNFLNSIPLYQKKNPYLSENSNLADFLIGIAEGGEINVAVASLRVLAGIYGNTDNESVRKTVSGRIAEKFFRKDRAIELQVIGEAMTAYGIILKDKAKETLINLYSEEEGYFLKPYIINAFSGFNDAGVYNEIRDLITKDVQNYASQRGITSGDMIAGPELSPVYRAFIETLNRLKNRAKDKDKNIMRLIFSEFVSSKDPSIIDVCLNALNDSIYSEYDAETSMILLYDYSDLVYPKDKESMKIFIAEFGRRKLGDAAQVLLKNLKSEDYEIAKFTSDAMKQITGYDYPIEAKRKYFHDLNFINDLGKKPFAVLKTYRGEIKIKLLPEVAPFTVQNFVKLAESGYYNNTIFHRVIPNFVVQGGDPLNNGWGGPEYTIRTEIAPVRYERGVVGMASDGKDTEGSQFFVTHSPFYHLDNRYTIFGKVISGMEVVDRLFVGDVLESVIIVDK